LNKLFKLEATPNRSRVRRKKRVKLPQRNLTLSVFFVILTLIAAVTVISLQQTQATQTQAETIGTYTSTATYDYTAAVQPSTIYGNKTIIKPQDGTIYTKLASNINLTLSYRFTSTLQNTPKITYNINSTLKTGAWKYQTSTTPKVTTQQATIQIALSSFDKQEIEQTKARIHRVGQKNGCTYIYLIAKGTVDSKILTALRNKADLAKMLIDDYRKGANPFASEGGESYER
jgi:hypothetical protein